MTPESLRRVAGLGDVIDPYKLLLIDAYGVLHDGRQVFPGVNETLARIRSTGRTVIIVTNSPQRVEGVAFRLSHVGVGHGLYDHIASSGELTWRDLETRNADGELPRLHFITQGSGVRWQALVPNPVVEDMAEADLIIAAGMPHGTEAEALASPLLVALDAARSRDLPMLVADSDETYPLDGMIRLGPGWIAQHYAGLGGTIVEYGKPHDPIYDEAMRLAGAVGPKEVLMIGDNLKTDVRGASRRGFDSLLVLEGGVHGGLTPAELTAAAAANGAAPTYVTRGLSW